MRKWAGTSKKRKTTHSSTPPRAGGAGDDSDDESSGLPFFLPKLPGGTHVYNNMNHVYFNDDISEDTVFSLNRELQNVKTRLSLFGMSHGIPANTIPIYLHLTTNGGSIHAAFSAVDCIKTLGVPVYTVVDGFVASAGTLISLAGAKRYIMPNAYMLIHELRSGVWGKMSTIEEEVDNLRKIMEHITTFYADNTKLTKRALEKLLTKDVIWNAQESINKGVAEEIYTGLATA